ncbi:hypothetical protein LTS17_003951 [Exophiala oligosperma]
MGDAGPPTPPPVLVQDRPGIDTIETPDESPLKEVRVLVTGFGPFKSFLINPSWLIASALPDDLPPPATTATSGKGKYKIKLVIHPSAIRVSYSTVSETVPELIRLHAPDFILHIGMAGGRDCYSLETRGHRDGYRIKDVDNLDGYLCGECKWKRDGVPPLLYGMWDEDDVLRRWEVGVQKELVARGFLGSAGVDENEIKKTSKTEGGDETSTKTETETETETGTGTNFVWGNNNQNTSVEKANSNASVTGRRAEENRKRAVVKLSKDAGRFLCEYALFESLSYRWMEAEKKEKKKKNRPTGPRDEGQQEQDEDKVRERLGKVAFLHVPGWTGVEDINRGVMIAEEAIKALIGSWEDGARRKTESDGKSVSTFTTQNSEVQ